MDISTVIGQVREPLRSYNFEVVLPVEFGDSQRLRYLVRRVSCPAFVNLEVEREVPLSLVYKGATVGGVGFEDLEVEFTEVEDRAVLSYFERWRSAMLVSDDSMSSMFYEFRLPVNYKKAVEVWWLDVQGQRKFGFKFERAFPVSVSVLEGSYEESGVVTVSVSFAYDYIKVL